MYLRVIPIQPLPPPRSRHRQKVNVEKHLQDDPNYHQWFDQYHIKSTSKHD